MDVEESKDGVESKDNNIDNMLNNSRTNFGGTSRRKKSYWNTEWTNLMKKVGNLNKTHDYHNSTVNLHSNPLRLFGLEEDKNWNQYHKYPIINKNSDLKNYNNSLLNNFKHVIKRNSNSRSSKRYDQKLDSVIEIKSKEVKQEKSEVKYNETSNDIAHSLI